MQSSKLADEPGSDNGTGFFQTLAAFKIREIYERKAATNKANAKARGGEGEGQTLAVI